MSTNSIRKLIATLASLLAVVCFLPVASAEYQEPQPLLPPHVYPQMFPGKSALELMQMSKDLFDRQQLRKRIKAGEVIHYGNLKVTSDPEGAGVLANSYVPLGATPFGKSKLPTGPYRVTVRKEGYYEQVRMVDITADKTSKMHFRLKAIPYAHLTVEASPPGAKIGLVGVAEDYEPGMKLIPGEYLLEVSHVKYGGYRLYATLGDNEKLTLTADLTAKPGTIKLTAKQPDATVYLDGQEAGRTPLTISGLLPGPHKLQVWKSLFKPITRAVQVKPGRDNEIVADLAPADHFANSLGMEFVKIPAGSFMMGFRDSPEMEIEKMNLHARLKKYSNVYFIISHSYPGHLVRITKPFYMQITEVTNLQYAQVTGSESRMLVRTENRPVRVNTMKEIDAFVTRLNKMPGKWRYRLPTEAEWEYTARAGTSSPFYTGETISTSQANYNGSRPPYEKGDKGLKRTWSIDVKSFFPNPWGLYDMYGNRGEVCADWKEWFYYTRSPINDPYRAGDKNGQFVKRGGSWSFGPDRCRSAIRNTFENSPKQSFDTHGFRLVAERVR